jgi:hypothetical protein
MPFLHVKMQLHAAPRKAFIKQMAECRRLTEIPLPTALAGKGFSEIRQIRGVVR